MKKSSYFAVYIRSFVVVATMLFCHHHFFNATIMMDGMMQRKGGLDTKALQLRFCFW